IVSRAVVPVQVSSDPLIPNAIEQGIAELMARQARMGSWETIPIREVEPITLNAATQIRDYLGRSAVNSVIVVSPGFPSRRSMLVYRAVLGEAGMQVRCDPVFGITTPNRWTDTWHGIQGVAEEFLKLQYYRFYVLPISYRKMAQG